MYSLLIVIIYLAFISLGLPDSLLGSGWPVMHIQLNAPLSFAGVISMIISGGTIISSLMSDRVTRKLGAGLVTAASTLLTAVALFGFSISRSAVALCIWAIPYGLGAGAIDAALNNYVALHYKSRHMSWLHCFWGVGATVSPYIMSFCLTHDLGWYSGYRTVSIIQLTLSIILFISLPIWKKRVNGYGEADPSPVLTLPQVLKIKGVVYMLATFFGYCGLEWTAALWASSYLVNYRGIDPETAAQFASLFFIGITVGRFLCGFISDRLGDKKLIRLGSAVIISGIVMVGLPLGIDGLALAGLVVIGFGCAPVYPSIIHSTPDNFGAENSQAIIGIQMATAYIGSTFMPPLFGLIADNISIGLYPVFLIVFAFIMIGAFERLNRVLAKKA